MSKFIGRSIDIIEELAAETDNAFDMTRRGYLYLTADEDTYASMAETAQLLADAAAVPRCTVLYTLTGQRTRVRRPARSRTRNLPRLLATSLCQGLRRRLLSH